MKINNSEVDVLYSCVLSGNYNRKGIRGQSYYAPISVRDLELNHELKDATICFDEIAELDKFIGDMLLLRSCAVKSRGYDDIHNNPLSPIEEYIHSVVRSDERNIIYEIEKLRREVENKDDKQRKV